MTQATFEKEALKPKDEVWVIDFWASWCGPCIEAMPHLKQLHRSYAGKNVRFISISWDESDMKWKLALDRFQMPWQQMRITKAQAAYFDAHFPHKGIPTAFVIRRDGKVKRSKGVGMLETTIQKALKTEKPQS
ncbi:MAG TPA: TlpA disulfide reductase family protein [Bacteroidia bacterium]|nr:TlpA disulfide reductase family protein [Bacteroidia bacterium]